MPQITKNLEGRAENRIIYRSRDRRSALYQAILIFTVSVCVLLSGCSNVATIWSGESRSPDGRWLALAHTYQYSGPGNAGLETVVFLKHTKGPKEPIQVLLLTQNARSIDLKMNWLAPSHLEVTYKQPAVIDFQAIRCGGVDISARDVSGGAISSPH
jgi:hypothetical protein